MADEEVPRMTVADVPDPVSELRQMLKEQQAVIIKQNEAIKDLTARMNENEKVAAAAVPAAAPEQPKEDPQDISFKAMLREMGVKFE